MKYEDSHLSDQQLLLSVEGELPPRDEKMVQAHLDACWKCRARCQELESAIADFIRMHEEQFDAQLPPIAGPRALLKAHMAQLSASEPPQPSKWFARRRFAWLLAAIACGFLAFVLILSNSGIGRETRRRPQVPVVSSPDSTLTPGAALLVSPQAICGQVNIKNKAVSLSLQRQVFEEYGIAGADPRAYEVDYLITPALGGADDIHNLWPHSYRATVWNAQVKDALEDRLREMVCDGSLDLREAQREIAGNWIAAYKKYFHTDKPLGEPRRQSAR